MAKIIQKILISIVLAGFLLSSANIPLFIHLAEHSNEKGGHHEDKCPICQQAAFNKPQAVVLTGTISIELPAVIDTNVCISEIVIQNSNFRIPYLRAPPTA
jgi:hypothetical protein